MNQRIRELAERAGIEFDDGFSSEPETIYYLRLSDFERFAELIIRECAGKVVVNEALNIFEHFDVEP